jgi:hypothetical protein
MNLISLLSDLKSNDDQAEEPVELQESVTCPKTCPELLRPSLDPESSAEKCCYLFR